MPKSKTPRSSPVANGLPLGEIFRRNVAIQMRRQGMTQVELADRAFLSNGGMSKIMRGVSKASAGSADRIAYALGVSVEAMYVPPAPGAYEGLFGTSPEYDSA